MFDSAPKSQPLSSGEPDKLAGRNADTRQSEIPQLFDNLNLEIERLDCSANTFIKRCQPLLRNEPEKAIDSPAVPATRTPVGNVILQVTLRLAGLRRMIDEAHARLEL